MKEIHIGAIIAYEREKKRISRERLCEGIFTPMALKRLEEGDRTPSYFILERLMERLGKSMNKLEILLHERDYEVYYLRVQLEKALEEERLQEAKELLSVYESLSVAKEKVHLQYLNKMKAVLSKKRGEGKLTLPLLEEALKATLPWWKKGFREKETFSLKQLMEEHSMGKEEITLLMMWLWQMWEEGKEIRVEKENILIHLGDYYEEDEEERADLFSKVCWVLGSLSMEQKQFEEAYYYTKEGQGALTENRILLHLPQYLERLVYLEKKLFQYENEYEKQRDALKEAFITYGKRWQEEEILLWKNVKIQEVYLLSELMVQERKLLGKSQEKVAEEMEIDLKTIGRLEGGIHKPKTETWKKIREYYEICKDSYNTRIVTKDFRLLELKKKISVLTHLNREEEAEALYNKLKPRLDLNYKENLQYTLFQDILYAHQKGKLPHEEALEQCRQAFQATRPNLKPEEVYKITLSTQECIIINYMGICYRKMDQRDKTIELLEKAMVGYKASKVDKKHYYHSLGLLYLNLIDNYEETNRFEEAIRLCDEAIRYDMDCGKGSDLGYLISERQYTIDRREGKAREEGKKCYQQAFQLMKLAKREIVMKELQTAYEEWYGEQLV